MSVSAVTVSLGFLSKEEPPTWPGKLLHGALFDRLRRVSPMAAEEAHSVEPRPFSISGIFRDGAHPAFRCAGLSGRVSEALSSAFEAGMEMDVGPSRVRVLDVKRETADYEGMYGRFVPGEDVFERVSLRFASPATFRVGKANMPFPTPRLLWRSWAARWNAFSKVQLGGFEEWAEEYIVPARFKLRSRTAKVSGATLVGCVGDCEYRVLRPDSIEARVAAMLAFYSQFCGTGQKTTMGLGMTELTSPWHIR